MLEKILELDRDLFLIINNSLESWFNDLFLGGLTLIGDVLFLLPIALVYLYIIDKKNFRKNSSILISAVLIGGLLVKIIKEVVGRPRPLKDMEPLLLAGKIQIHNVLQPYRENSFPSGHTQGAFGTATALICIYRKHTFFLLVIAFLIGLSRIYVGVHFPLDVICGAILGIIISLAVFTLSARFIK
jgi:undecaprenyl-diphosphatase